MVDREQRLRAILIQLVPADCSAVGNGALFVQFCAAALAEKLRAPTQEDFQRAREALLEAGLIVKGRGRGGSNARAIPLNLPVFELAPSKPGSPSKSAKPAAKKPMTDTQLEAWEAGRDLEAELLEAVRQYKRGEGRVVYPGVVRDSKLSCF